MKPMTLKNCFYCVFRELTVSVTDKTGLSCCLYQFDLEFHVICVMRAVLVYRHTAQLIMDLY